MKFLRKYWWLVLIALIATAVAWISLMPDDIRIKSSIKDILDYLESFSVIVVGVLGLLWAYPLLKKKATESFVEKQVEIIFNANKELREQCIVLLDKYPVKMRSNNLTIDDVAEALTDAQMLYSNSVEANYDAYRYSYLLYNSIKTFYASVTGGIPSNFYASYYREDFHNFLHKHIDQILQYSSTVDSIARIAIESQKKLVKNVDKYVIGNDLKVIPGVNGKVHFYKADALLVLFFSNNLDLPDRTHLLHESCYKTVPNGASFARLMDNQKWYAPIHLNAGDFFAFEDLRLDLVGYKQMVSHKLGSGDVEHYVILYYSNITHIGFVPSSVKDKHQLVSCEDAYLRCPVLLREEDISEMWTEGERVGIKVQTDILKAKYKSLKRILHKQMRKEL